jgi:CubicO group peptidase (beta-lactamase class C family)
MKRKNHMFNLPLYQKYIRTALFFLMLVIISCGPDHGKEKIPADNPFELRGKSIQESSTGMDAEKLAEIPLKMQQFVEENKTAGTVTLVARNGRIASFEAVGYQDLENEVPMQKNTLFRIASMTKPFVGAAIMMMVEEGKLSIDDPVEKFLPEFSGIWLISEKTGDEMQLIRPSRPINIRDILSHTHGMSGVPPNTNVESLREYTLVVSQLPLEFEPGSRWKYGGSGITAAARIVEVLSGMSYTDFLQEKIFTPLGMKNTCFSFPEEHAGLIAKNYGPDEEAGLKAREKNFGLKYFRPDAGLFSTAYDMAIWMQTILDGGIYGETRILSKESVQQMIRTQTGELETGFTKGMSFGLAFQVVKDPTGVTGMLSPGTFGHGGALGTQYWADPGSGTIYILMIQRQGFGTGDSADIRQTFQEIAASAIVN